ncbi:response regulator transcription factor [Sanguibacter antarcticus]|uniref:LuxR family two component transcriptional regulator n=1 Tax=Sanguibacter antarcticus TaxID=372484 RepID=A0A2A9E2H4_9MICO|nr:response regulator transcription factor [Sanguibacter antarcticus]PFG32555.1 LuxR family two component transcriptional regulator [Sanguibacter antarcticus]
MRILIAEDSAILRDGLVALLTRRGHEVVGAVGDGAQLVSALAALPPGSRPDVVVIDIRMPPTFTDEGLQAALEIRALDASQGVLLFSQYVETRFATQLLAGDSRGVGYLLKDRVADVSDFIDALERIAAGHTVLDPEVVNQLMRSPNHDDGISRLTPREREVLEIMAEGRSNTAIAEQLVLSYGAVEKNVSSIFSKLDLPIDAGDHRRVLAVLKLLQA